MRTALRFVTGVSCTECTFCFGSRFRVLSGQLIMLRKTGGRLDICQVLALGLWLYASRIPISPSVQISPKGTEVQ